jgi:hypothetical protein
MFMFDISFELIGAVDMPLHPVKDVTISRTGYINDHIDICAVKGGEY